MRTTYFSRKPLLAFFLMVWIASITSFESAHAENKGEGSASKTQMDPETQAMMSKWKEFSTPGENHKILNPLAGNWDYVVKWWMAPGGDPEVSKGKNKNSWIMGGRFIQMMTSGMSMGQPFEGMGLLGFDNNLKKYQSTWIDNMGTGIMKAESTYDPAKKIFSEQGHFTDPLFGELAFRGETKIIDDDHYVYKMFTVQKNGQEFQSLEISYSREK